MNEKERSHVNVKSIVSKISRSKYLNFGNLEVFLGSVPEGYVTTYDRTTLIHRFRKTFTNPNLRTSLTGNVRLRVRKNSLETDRGKQYS